jgi:hypothetical protein
MQFFQVFSFFLLVPNILRITWSQIALFYVTHLGRVTNFTPIAKQQRELHVSLIFLTAIRRYLNHSAPNTSSKKLFSYLYIMTLTCKLALRLDGTFIIVSLLASVSSIWYSYFYPVN